MKVSGNLVSNLIWEKAPSKKQEVDFDSPVTQKSRQLAKAFKMP